MSLWGGWPGAALKSLHPQVRSKCKLSGVGKYVANRPSCDDPSCHLSCRASLVLAGQQCPRPAPINTPAQPRVVGHPRWAEEHLHRLDRLCHPQEQLVRALLPPKGELLAQPLHVAQLRSRVVGEWFRPGRRAGCSLYTTRLTAPQPAPAVPAPWGRLHSWHSWRIRHANHSWHDWQGVRGRGTHQRSWVEHPSAAVICLRCQRLQLTQHAPGGGRGLDAAAAVLACGSRCQRRGSKQRRRSGAHRIQSFHQREY